MSDLTLVETLVSYTKFLIGLVAILIPVAFGVELLRRVVGPDHLQTWIGGRGSLAGLVRGVTLGVITPFCSVSTTPVLAGLLQTGVRASAAAAFTLASPLLNPIVVALLATLVGWKATAGYAVITVIMVLVVAKLADSPRVEQGIRAAARPSPEAVAAEGSSPHDEDHTNRDDDLLPDVHIAEVEACSSGADSEALTWRHQVHESWQGALQLMRTLALPLLGGVALGAAISLLVPSDVLRDLAAPGRAWSVPVAAFVGIPIYLNSASVVPIGSALLDKGVGLGPVFAMFIGGMGASVPEVVALSGLLKPRLIAAYLIVILLVATAGGYIVPFVA
jgi:uncharacterized membrane protein YraQ (UPF0718 family)